MPRYPDVKGFDHAAAEREILAWWDAHDVFEQSLALREGAPHFVFYEGPPTANGKPGIHHVMARTIKDLFCRYKTMKGFRVDRKAGWDTHGLPVEIEVEKELGLEGRHQVEGPKGIGVAEYNAKCRESVLRYKDLWDGLTRRMGYWVDLSDPYVTFENDYIESVWNLLQRIAERRTPSGESFLYRGYKIQWYSPGSGTVLSSHEVSLGYREIQDPSVYVRFPVDGEPDTYFLAWTTTPWTLVSNTALAVGEGIDYVKVRRQKEDGEPEHFYLAESLLSVLNEDHEVVERMRGADLVGKTYRPLFDTFVKHPEADAAWRVVPADFVSTEDGTGIVHMAPAFGADDFAVGKREGLPLFNPIESDGTFTDAVPLVAGEWFKEADKTLARDLRERGLLYRHETYLHNYPHDWRKGTPLMSYPVESWFIRTTAIRDRMIELNRTINWQPEGIGEGRFGQWLEGNVDWAISRMRYWGTPIPIWVNDANEDDYVVIGSIAELREKAGLGDDEELDLHRPFVDEITWPAPGGGTYRRIPDLLDVWFDSGAMPFAQWHAPFENDETFEQNFPADFIAEGVDQTRGWFYTLHAIAALVRDSVAYKNVVVNGLVLDENGEKMSKSKGNSVDPFEAIAEHGVDPLRWSMMSQSAPWESLRYSDRAVEETKRKFFNTITNTYSFFATYAGLDGFEYDPADTTPVAERAELDRWILSRLNTTVGRVDAAFDAYHPTSAARATETFVDDLSNWYLRRSRRRFWKSESDADKRAAYETVYECLTTLAKLMAPLAPFYAEWLWDKLKTDAAVVSVHLADFPTVDDAVVDEALEERMDLARTIASITLALRNEAGVNVRQPLGGLSVVTGTAGVDEAVLRSVEAIVLDEVNVKALESIGSGSALVEKSAKPNFKALGRRLGPKMKAANAAIRALDTDAITAYEKEGELTLALDGEDVTFGPGDIEVTSEGIEGHLVGQVGSVTVALDTTLTEDLRKEGLAREFVNRVQNLRKAAGFEVSDRIIVTFGASPALGEAIRTHEAVIRSETLAEALDATAAPEGDAVRAFEIGVRRTAAEAIEK
jgi:isoleucyl-tRNA synthetase